MFYVVTLSQFLRWLDLVCNAFCSHEPYDRVTHIKSYTQNNRLFLTAINCSLHTVSSFALGKSAAWMTPGLSQPPTPSIFKLVCLEVIAVLYYNNRGGDFHACDLHHFTNICLSFIKVIVLAPISAWFSTTAKYLSSGSFMDLCVPCYCDVYCVYCVPCGRAREDVIQ